ncbi:MAG: DUF664 domain-containing protein [Actinomycetota bacterium]|nr:DUF664 domain-containing protein [Actinomycetota bacterium]
MDAAAILLELYGRVPPLARRAVEGLSPEQLVTQPSSDANPIGWLVWHLARVQDHHVAELMSEDQVWVSDGWSTQFGLGPDPSNIGYGHTPEEVEAVKPEGPQALIDYLGAVDAVTRPLLGRLSEGDLDRIVDRRWDPPVSMGVRLVSIADDSLQHVGQALYLRGLFDR